MHFVPIHPVGVATLLVALTAWSAPQGDQESVKLPFELEQSQKVTYQVAFEEGPNLNRDLERDAGLRREREDESIGERSGDQADQPYGQAEGNRRSMRLEMNVREKQKDVTVVQVRVQPTASHGKEAERAGGDAERENRAGERDRSEGRDQSGQARQGHDQDTSSVSELTFLARVDSNGIIRSLDRHSDVAKGGSEDAPERGEAGVQARPASSGQQDGLEEKILVCLEAIFGSGLHGQELKTGQSYKLGGKADTTGKSVKSAAMGTDRLELTLLLKGKSGKQATFDVLGPAARAQGTGLEGTNGQDHEGASNEPKRPQGERKAKAAEGRAIYSLENGCLKSLIFRCSSLDETAGQNEGHSAGGRTKSSVTSLTITRSEDGKTGG